MQLVQVKVNMHQQLHQPYTWECLLAPSTVMLHSTATQYSRCQDLQLTLRHKSVESQTANITVSVHFTTSLIGQASVCIHMHIVTQQLHRFFIATCKNAREVCPEPETLCG